MDTKLTLSLDKAIIEKAKKYAKERKISLSKLIESYLDALTIEENKKVEITPLVKSLSGVIKLEEGADTKEEYIDYLNEKYQ